jgi:hypothetical protein
VATLRLTKAEHDYLTWLLEDGAGRATLRGTPDKRALESVRTKLEVSALVKGKGRAPGISVRAATDAFRRVLGDRLVLPPSGAAGVFAAMGKRLALLNLTEDDCEHVARAAAARWRGPVKAESLIRQAETLLSDAPQGTAPQGTPPLEMEDIS